MPNFDGTGPTGRGPRTGRGLGSCKSKRRKTPLGGFSVIKSPVIGRGGGGRRRKTS